MAFALLKWPRMKTNLIALAWIALWINPSSAQVSCQSVLAPRLEPKISERYGVKDPVVFTPNSKIPVIFRNPVGPAQTVEPGAPIREIKNYDAVIVGGGPAGLTSALYLAEAGKSVLILERNSRLGGLAAGGALQGIRAGGGAAYSVGPDGAFQYKMFQKIGLGDYKKKLTIQEPIDSYVWKGHLYKGLWEEKTLAKLPASFTLFKHMLLQLSEQGAGDLEGDLAKWADHQTMANLVRQMPTLAEKYLAEHKNPKMAESLERLKKAPQADPMKDVIDLLDLYGRSALGGTADQISARQFIDFYASELDTRYTGSLGTGSVVETLISKLKKYQNVEIRTGSAVTEIENLKAGDTRTQFMQDGKVREASAKNVIFAAPVTMAPKVIKNLAVDDPQKVAAISDIQMTDYAVHVVHLKGHNYRASYDTWMFSGGKLTQATDYILGRWQDPSIHGFDGFRNFKKDPKDDYGIMTIYQPMGVTKPMSQSDYLKIIDDAVEQMKQKFKGIAHGDLKPELVESYFWPQSIHMVKPGYLDKIPFLERTVGHIHFANNTVQAPELESSMERGAREALKILEAP